jgi:hypothetical protein
MWYRAFMGYEEPVSYDKGTANMHYDEIIIRNAAARAVRRIMFTRGVYPVMKTEIKPLVDKVVAAFKEKFGDMQNLRFKITETNLTPLVDKITQEVVK